MKSLESMMIRQKRRMAEEAPETNVVPLPKADRQKYRARPHEFFMPDGRPFMLVRHAVIFACPQKDAPDSVTIVGVRTGKPVPLAVPYAEFAAWWATRMDGIA